MVEFFAVIILLFLIFIAIKTLFKSPYKDSPIKASLIPFKSKKSDCRDSTESWVENELKSKLLKNGYVIFGDLIIPSVSKSIPSTQIDHVIVSRYGIFCLETKSHQGNIYGYEKSEKWKQYLGNKDYSFYSPIKQNKHHVKSLEYLLRSRLKSPIHSYIVFPSAHRVKINGNEVDLTLSNTIKKIENHKREVYTFEDIEAISKGLAYVSTKSFQFSDEHIESVRRYIATKDANMLVHSSKYIH